MNCYFKIIVPFVCNVYLFLGCFDVSAYASSFTLPTHFVLGRINLPTSSFVDGQRSVLDQRKYKKHCVSAAGAAGTLALVYSLSCIRKAAIKKKIFCILEIL